MQRVLRQFRRVGGGFCGRIVFSEKYSQTFTLRLTNMELGLVSFAVMRVSMSACGGRCCVANLLAGPLFLRT